MLVVEEFEPRFVKSIPSDLELGVLYVSMEYGAVVHSCCCGCGQEVVTPLTPTDWHLEYDGEAITLRPSVGNWTLPCRSHYIIRRNRVIECADWDDEMVEEKRRRDAQMKREFYKTQKTLIERPALEGRNEKPKVRERTSFFARWWK